MKTLTDEQWHHLIHALQDFEKIAEALDAEVGNEATIELHLRLKELKEQLACEEWR
jgi:hypothetical protein